VAGDYTVTLTATNAFGFDDEVKLNYVAATAPPQNPPVAAFVGSPLSGEIPLTVDFTDQSTEAPTSWLWDFGDGNTSTLQNPSHTYTVAGDYTVTLTATNAFGFDDEVKLNYIAATAPPQNPPVAAFVGAPTSGYAPLTVNFTDQSTENPTSWLWNFGDGNTSTAQNPSHVYADLGTYTVTLTATNAYGSDGETKVDYIAVADQPPFEQVFALSDIPVLGTVTGNYTNTYVSDNSYEVITEVASTNHPVKVTSNLQHKWNFSVGGGTGVTFYLEAYRPDNGDGDDFAFEYSTDDATYLPLVTVASSTEQVYSVALPDALTGTVYVRVTDDNRSWDLTSMDPIYIDQMYIEYSTAPSPPVANFAGSPVSGNVPLTVNFTDLSTGAPDTWAWNFGDGGTSTAQNPSHQYMALGQYTVTMTATNAYGSDVETKTNYINVTEAGSSMHVQNMTVGRRKVGPNYVGTCTVLMYDTNANPVSGATVYVTATGPTSGTYNGVTAADGTVSFETSGFKKPVGEWCFEVTNVTHATLTYDVGANVVTKACESGPVFKNGDELLPADFALGQNRPNPFNPATEIAFSLPQAGHVTLHIYNVAGQKVATLVDEVVSAGTHVVQWDASTFSSGVYLYRLQADTFTETKKMVLLK
jgi:PKD repeat protein